MTDEPAQNQNESPGESVRDDLEAAAGPIPFRERFGLVLALLLALYVLAAFDVSPLLSVLMSLLWAAVLLTILWLPDVPRRLRRMGVAALALVVITSISLGLISTDVSDGWQLIILAVAQLAAMLAILNRVLRHEIVTFQTVMGGIAAYALIAFIMASVYNAGELFSNHQFLNGVVDQGDYTYFSFVTLTTVGYGDITAASDLAKRLVVVEAFVGQVFIITLVARLVSLWGKPLSE